MKTSGVRILVATLISMWTCAGLSAQPIILVDSPTIREGEWTTIGVQLIPTGGEIYVGGTLQFDVEPSPVSEVFLSSIEPLAGTAYEFGELTGTQSGTFVFGGSATGVSGPLVDVVVGTTESASGSYSLNMSVVLAERLPSGQVVDVVVPAGSIVGGDVEVTPGSFVAGVPPFLSVGDIFEASVTTGIGTEAYAEILLGFDHLELLSEEIASPDLTIYTFQATTPSAPGGVGILFGLTGGATDTTLRCLTTGPELPDFPTSRTRFYGEQPPTPVTTIFEDDQTFCGKVPGGTDPDDIPTEDDAVVTTNQLLSGDGPGDPASAIGVGLGCAMPQETSQSIPVYLRNGELRFTTADLQVPSRGFPFVWARTYSSRGDFQGPLGYNWDFNYDRRLFLLSNGDVSLVNGFGREDVYGQTSNPDVFAAPEGRFEQLVRNSDGIYTQTLRSLMQYTYDAQGLLVRKEDRCGNVMTFERNANGSIFKITDTQGRAYFIAYDSGTAPDYGDGAPDQKITSLTDFDGRQVAYGYDGNGDLRAVRSPVVVEYPDGKTTRYSYSSGQPDSRLNHNLLTITQPLYNAVEHSEVSTSVPYVEITYSPETDPTHPEFDRVKTQHYGSDTGQPPGVAAPRDVGGIALYEYSVDLASDPQAPVVPVDPASAVSRTRYTDRNGNVSRFYFAAHGRVIRIVRETNRDVRPGEGDHVYSYQYNSDLLLVERVRPRGNRVHYAYDSASPLSRSRGNLLEIRRSSGSLSAQPDLVRRFTYDPIWNFLRTRTDERAFPTGVVPVLPSGKIDLADPLVARYTIENRFDYQEGVGFQASQGIPPSEWVPEGFADLNGAVDFNEGNIVQILYPEIQTGPDTGERRVLTRTTNQFGQPLTYVDGEGEVLRYEYFDSNGVPEDPSDKEGYLRLLVRDDGRLNLTTTFDYDHRGNVTSVLDPKMQEATLEYNALNQVRTIWSRPPDATVPMVRYRTTLEYDLNDNVVTTRRSNHDESGAEYTYSEIVDTFEYDILSYLIATNVDRTMNDGSAPGSIRTEFFYDANFNLTAVRSPEAVSGRQPNNIETYLFDERDLLYKVTRGDDDVVPDNSPPSDAVVMAINYDGNANLIEVIDRIRDGAGLTSLFPGSLGGDVTRNEFDAFDRRLKTIDGESNEASWTHDEASNVLSMEARGPKDHTTFALDLLAASTFLYDELGRQYQMESRHFNTADGTDIGDGAGTTIVAFDRENRRESVTDDRGYVTSFDYDTADRLYFRMDALGNEVELSYDDNDNVVLVTRRDVSSDFPGSVVDVYVSSLEYDGLDRMCRSEDPGGNIREYFFDSRGNTVKTSDGVRGAGHPSGPGNIVRYEFDVADRMLDTVRELRHNGRGDGVLTDLIQTQQTIDENSRVTERRDDSGNVTLYRFDALNRLSEIEYADGEVKSYEYDEDDRLESWVDQNGSQCGQIFDGLGRLVRRDVTRGVGVFGTTFEEFGYDGVGRVTRVQSDNGFSPAVMVCLFAYDSHSNRTLDDQDGLAVVSGYDGVGNRTSFSYPESFLGAGRREFEAEFDALNRACAIRDVVAGPITNYHYKGPSRVERRTYGPESSPFSQVDFAYDDVPRVIEMAHSASGAVFAGVQYGYDREHNRTFEKYMTGANPGRVFRLDSIYRVVREDTGVSALATVSAGQDIDAEVFEGSSKQSWSYDGVGNRVKSRETGWFAALSPGGSNSSTVQSTYVSNEVNEYRVVERGDQRRKLRYDRNGNLVWDGRREMSYDYRNRLVEVREGGTSALIARYAYDPDGRRGLKEIPGGGTRYLHDDQQCVSEWDSAGQLQRQYVWGQGVDELLEIRAPAGAFYAHESAIGSVLAVTDASGSVVESYSYDAFGRTVAVGASDLNEYRHHTVRLDPESGLYYMRARYYDPALGRFLQRDPLGSWEDPLGLGNGYTFAGNGPAVWRDPGGTSPFSILAKQVVKHGLKKALREFAEKQLTRRLKRYVTKKFVGKGNAKDFAKELAEDIDELLGILDSTWWELCLEATPGFGDVYGAGRLGMKVREAYAHLQDLENKWVGKLAEAMPDAARAQFMRNMRRLGVNDRKKDIDAQNCHMGTDYEYEGLQGHHRFSVGAHPDRATDPRNIEFLDRQSHLDAHGGDYRNATHGPDRR